MLALWSRATRTPGTCRCISCVSKEATLTTRTGVRTSWLLTTPTSTFVYTSVFAAGLAIDAKSKQKRNRQWDTAFAQLRGEMGQPVSNDSGMHPLATDAYTIEEALSSEIDMDVLHQLAGVEICHSEWGEEIEPKIDFEQISESFWDYLPFDNRLPGGQNKRLAFPANTGPNMVEHHLPPQSLWSPDNLRWKSIRKRHTWKKLAIQELAISELIHSLLAPPLGSLLSETDLASLSPVIRTIASLTSDKSWADRHLLRNYMGMVASTSMHIKWREVERLKEKLAQIKGPGIPAYHQDSDGDFYDITEQMNKAIRRLLDDDSSGHGKYNSGHFPLTVAKVCHNLLVSSATPDVQTFNILLTRFKRKRQPKLVSHVIRAMENCKIRPNEITCAVILDHYKDNDDPERFSKFVALMRGSQNALMLARPDITINETGQSRLIRVSEDKVYQKVHPTPLVFNSLMLGVLKFAGFDRAMDIYFEMKEDGWGLDTLGLSHFLRDCVRRADWNGGAVIWEEISSIKRKINESHMAKAYSDMLSLCSVTGNTVAFNQLINEVARRGWDRGRILRSAEATQRRTRGAAAPSSPAWTADNLLIAVSGLMGNEQQGAQDMESFPSALEQDELQWDQTPPTLGGEGHVRTSDYSAEVTSSSPQPQPPAQPPLSKEEAWNIWLQHELGELPTDSSIPNRGDDMPTFSFDQNEKSYSGE